MNPLQRNTASMSTSSICTVVCRLYAFSNGEEEGDPPLRALGTVADGGWYKNQWARGVLQTHGSEVRGAPTGHWAAHPRPAVPPADQSRLRVLGTFKCSNKSYALGLFIVGKCAKH